MDRKLLDILACPASRQPLAMLDAAGLDAMNQAIAAGHVRRALAEAGFAVSRAPGFGRKRHMSTGTLA